VSTNVLAGDPSKPGFYTIILSVPANTTIPAHSHRGIGPTDTRYVNPSDAPKTPDR